MFTRGYTKHGLAIPMANMLYKNLTCFYQVMLGTPYLCCHSIKATMCVLFQWCLNIKNCATMDEHINPFINHYIESLFFFNTMFGNPMEPPYLGVCFFFNPVNQHGCDYSYRSRLQGRQWRYQGLNLGTRNRSPWLVVYLPL